MLDAEIPAHGFDVTRGRDLNGPIAAFFWGRAAILDDPADIAGYLPRSADVSPLVIHASRPVVHAYRSSSGGGELLVTTRGTASVRDVLTDLTIRRAWPEFAKRVRKAVASREKGVAAAASHPRTELVAAAAARLAEDDLRQAEASELGFHHGFYLHALRALRPLLEAVRRLRPSAVVLYGHSMGGAVASFLYRWLRILGIDARCAITSCPAICDRACFDMWFARFDDGARARHYYARDDAVVGSALSFFSFDRRVTALGEYACDAIKKTKKTKRKDNAEPLRYAVRHAIRSALRAHDALVPSEMRNTRTGRGIRGLPAAFKSGVVLTGGGFVSNAFRSTTEKSPRGSSQQ